MIIKINQERVDEVVTLALLLWPDNDQNELREEFSELLTNKEAIIYGEEIDDELVAFAQCQLRHDYVEGTESNPVGYLEGIFVKEPYRLKGVARELCKKCEEWSVVKGCKEFASDCELDNTESLAMHLKLGFVEANRLICFTKSI
ncbi:GNAT family N-acetyltransferase [Vagococcus coleopterorum]|uniref:Aminoglycoside N(6')-acetyltransferase type 1 n=1 Tax=Vagococcus coleopterorum TaxID=2714946 RepID=A0A6G8ANK7_9ENTE|nr:aminoglycoside 6'-N-acetyltransferase [Vagococcus coleopterorum]QIL46577.1 GNAT family N-acetyltransferase [Vagococcus coleopterorum]